MIGKRANGWTWTTTAAAAAAAVITMTAAAPARAAVDLPASAVTEDTLLVVWLDAEELTPEKLRASAERINAVLPEQMRHTPEELDAQLDAGLGEFGEGHGAFLEAGGRGMVMLMRSQADGDGFAAEEPTMLIRVAPGTDAEEFSAVMRQFAGDAANDADLAEYADGWLADPDTLPRIPTDGQPEHAERFQRLLDRTPTAPVRLGFYMTDAAREAAAAAHEQATGQQQGAMMMNPGVQLLGPAQHIEAGWATLTLGDDLAIRPVIQFQTDQDAEQFRSHWEGLMTFGQQIFQMQFAQMPEQPDQEAVAGLFRSLHLERDGRELSGEIGDEFLTRLGEVAPALEPMINQMLMMRGMGAPGQQQQPPMMPPGQQPQQPGPPPPPQ